MKERIQTIQNRMRQEDLQALFIFKEQNVHYMSGFPDEAAYLLLTLDQPLLITDGRFFEVAQKSCPDYAVVNWQKDSKSALEKVIQLCEDLGVRRLGFEKQWLRYEQFETLQKSAAQVQLVGTANLVENLRFIKNAKEIEILKEASRITDLGLGKLLEILKPGMTEKEAAAHLEFILKTNGADGVGFATILISGAKTSLPHGVPGDKVIEKGDLVTIDFGALLKGYTSDMTRTVVMGQPTERQREIYQAVLDSQMAGLEAIRAGISSDVPDQAVRKVLEPYLEYYYPGIGHGIGLELHEPPFISKNGGYQIEENCVITMEPGLYIPGWGGVRIEDSVVVTKDGCERITFSPKELLIIE